jgi:pimeloyl-ACP methyl ester carboxylesterase
MRGNGQAETAQTRFVVANGHRIAYRSVGDSGSHGVPIVFLNRFRGSMDDWDPALINAVARDRRVILFDNVGVGESDGQTPGSLERAADDAVGFIRALGLTTVDVLGWSLGGMTAQIIAAKYPDLVRKLTLAATLPPGGSPDVVVTQGKWDTVARQPSLTEGDLLYLYFSPSPEGSVAGRASLERISFRRSAFEIKTRTATMRAQYQAATAFFRNEENWYKKIKSIQAPTLVANGDRDPAFPAIDSVVLANAIPKSRLALYSDAGHGFQFQYPQRFATDLGIFLRH